MSYSTFLDILQWFPVSLKITLKPSTRLLFFSSFFFLGIEPRGTLPLSCTPSPFFVLRQGPTKCLRPALNLQSSCPSLLSHWETTSVSHHMGPTTSSLLISLLAHSNQAILVSMLFFEHTEYLLVSRFLHMQFSRWLHG